jgi:epoxyqueuosine reductase QueG
MGNRRDPRYVAPLTEALAEGEPLVREHASWALERIEESALRFRD